MKINDLNITQTEIDDIEDIISIERLSFRIPWTKNAFIQEIKNNKLALYISAKIGNKVVGYAGMWIILDEAHITNIVVHPEFRRVKIGSKLLEKLINISKEKGITKMTLEVKKRNKVARHLYKKYGFEEAGIRKEYYPDDGDDAVIMWRE